MNLLRNIAIVSLLACAAAGWAQDGAHAGKHLVSTYVNGETDWLRGNLHTHTTESDGKLPPQQVVDLFAALGYDFLAISDHDKLTDPAPLDAKGMTLIPSVEVTAKGPHLQHIGATKRIAPEADRQQVLDNIAQDTGFAIMNHPNWTSNYNHCPLETLEALKGYAGIEIFNGVILDLEGSELATDKWDRLLAQGRRVWGFANDDSHVYPDHAGRGWSMVQSASRDAADIVAALRAGRFYASTGVTAETVDVEGLTVAVNAPNAQQFRVYADRGRVIHIADGPELRFTLDAGKPYTYIRVECYGPGSATAWLQPMFIEE